MWGIAEAPAQTKTPGSEVVVIYNSRMPESRRVAEHYAMARGVPASQVTGFPLPSSEEISRANFQENLQKPLFEFLRKQRLWKTGMQAVFSTNSTPAKKEPGVVESKIRYAVLCYGVPTKISKAAEIREAATEHLKPELQRNEAAVDSELALLPLLERKLPIGGPLANPLFSATNATVMHPTNGVLMVARLDGPSADIASGLVDKAIQAEKVGLWGNTYFDVRNTTEEGYKIGDTWIRNASEIARRLGYDPVVDENPGTFPPGFPMSKVAFYAGWYDEHVSGPFAHGGVDFMPGAFAYHLHSLSAGTIRSTNRNWVGPLLAQGVTATMGSVDEPYLAGTPDISVFAARFLFNGFSFGESAYASQPVLSWQITVVGDPLYRPLARGIEDLGQELSRTGSPFLEWYFLRLINLNVANGKSVIEAANLLEGLELTKKSALLTEKLAGLYATQGKPASALHAYEQALKLADGVQKLRLLLELGERRQEAGDAQAAYDHYETLLSSFPNYPDKLQVYRNLAELAGKLNKTAERERYEKEINQLSPKKVEAFRPFFGFF